MEFDEAEAEAEAVFRMKPSAVIEGVARQLVEQQVALAKVRKLAAELPNDDPRTAEFRAQAAELGDKWIREGLPNTAAGLRLALEVLDTYGPDGVDVEDGVDAAIWNNKFFVYRNEFTPRG